MPTPLQELELFCQQQIARLKAENAASRVIVHTSPDVPADLAKAHAVGPKKPSLSELERDEEQWVPVLVNRKRY